MRVDLVASVTRKDFVEWSTLFNIERHAKLYMLCSRNYIAPGYRDPSCPIARTLDAHAIRDEVEDAIFFYFFYCFAYCWKVTNTCFGSLCRDQYIELVQTSIGISWHSELDGSSKHHQGPCSPLEHQPVLDNTRSRQCEKQYKTHSDLMHLEQNNIDLHPDDLPHRESTSCSFRSVGTYSPSS